MKRSANKLNALNPKMSYRNGVAIKPFPLSNINSSEIMQPRPKKHHKRRVKTNTVYHPNNSKAPRQVNIEISRLDRKDGGKTNNIFLVV